MNRIPSNNPSETYGVGCSTNINTPPPPWPPFSKAGPSASNIPSSSGRRRPAWAARPVASAGSSAVAGNQWIIDKYLNGKTEKEDVLKVTTKAIRYSNTSAYAMRCMSALRVTDVSPNIYVYSALISACAKGCDLGRAMAVFNDMQATGIAPDVVIYNILLSACEKGGDAHQAMAVFNDMQATGIKPDVITYSTLISACAKAGELGQAMWVLGDMRGARIAPNVITYNSLISACEKTGDLGQAMWVFNDMQATVIAPDVITYNALISTCGKAGDLGQAMAVFKDMRRARIAPTVITYSTLILACAKASDVTLAMKVFGDMRSAHITPNVITYHALVSAFDNDTHNGPNMAQQALAQAMADGVFQESLGYEQATNTLDFHLNKIEANFSGSGHVCAISASVAKAIFEYHVIHGNLSHATEFIVGQHGNDMVKNTIWQQMLEYGMSPAEGSSHNRLNRGVLMCSGASASAAQTRMNPAAPAFIPKIQHSPTPPTSGAASRKVLTLRAQSRVSYQPASEIPFHYLPAIEGRKIGDWHIVRDNP